MSDNLNFEEVQRLLGFGAFMELQRDMLSPEVKVWRRKVTGVSRVRKGGDQSKLRAIAVKYEPIQPKNPNHVDPGSIETGLTGPGQAPELIGRIAKEAVGKWCTFYQSNTAKSDDNPHGFRQLVWLEPQGRSDNSRGEERPPQAAQAPAQAPPPQAPPPQPPAGVTADGEISPGPPGETPSQRARRLHEEQQRRPFTDETPPPQATHAPIEYHEDTNGNWGQQAATNLGQELREKHQQARDQAKQLQPGEEPFRIPADEWWPGHWGDAPWL